MSEGKCRHGRYKTVTKMVNIALNELNLKQLTMKVSIICVICQERFIFKGPTGFSTTQPLASPDGLELRVPIDWPLDPAELDIDVESTTGELH